ncbi:hypothetical protein [Micromonospora eburnea]|uniref:hypothetical protein n=1 Tax=Micromonospora eburnea TaxID=227316 RepID=UPI00114CA16C|nr:hypothetical protein [Micromonospora eburnea]
MTTMAEPATTITGDGSRDRTLLLSAAGVPLGTLAFVGDELPKAAGHIVLTLTSNEFAWGAAALVAGYLVRRARRAPMVATAFGGSGCGFLAVGCNRSTWRDATPS